MGWIGLLFGWIPKTIAGAWNWITKSRENTLLTLLAIAIGAAIFFWNQSGNRQDRIDQIEAAQKKATEDQVAANAVPAIKSIAIAEKSNAEAPAYYRNVADAARSNAIPGSVRCQTNSGSTPNLSRANPPVESVHGSDSPTTVVPGPELVCRPKADDDQLIYASSRAVKMRQEALDLIDQGVAVPYGLTPEEPTKD